MTKNISDIQRAIQRQYKYDPLVKDQGERRRSNKTYAYKSISIHHQSLVPYLQQDRSI
jgi:hypothetical protein